LRYRAHFLYFLAYPAFASPELDFGGQAARGIAAAGVTNNSRHHE